MRVSIIILLLLLAVALGAGLYVWQGRPAAPRQSAARPKIELEKIFKGSPSCDECGLTPLD